MVIDKEATQNKIAGLRERRTQLRSEEKLFTKAAGIEELTEKSRQEVERFEKDIDAVKKDLAEYKAQKEAAIAPTLLAMREKISSLLPVGEGRIEIDDDGKVIIGWLFPVAPFVNYEGLSGGQKVIFDQALADALLKDVENKVLIYEGAEVDPANLKELLNKLPGVDAQTVVNTWFDPEEIPDDWKVVYLK